MSALKQSDIKARLLALSCKERHAVLARATMVLFCLAVMISAFEQLGINEYEMLLSVVFLCGTGIFFTPALFLILFWMFFLPLMADLHLFLSYGLSLSSFGEQIFAVVCDTNKTEIIEYLARIELFIWFSLIVMVFASSRVLFFRPEPAGISRKQKTIIIGVILLMYPFTYVRHVYPIVLSKFSTEKNDMISRSLAFRFNPVKQNKADTVVVLIGESHRQAEFGPVFDQYASRFENLYRFTDMVAPFAGTLNAVQIILSRKKVSDLYDFFYEKSLFSLFREAGYATYFLHYVNTSSELNGLSFIYREAGHFVKYEHKEEARTDEGIYSVLDDILKNGERKKLIVIKMIGVHIDFRHRYPNPEVSFFRYMASLFKPKTKKQEMYHYNKAVAYSAGIIANIMEKVEKRPEPSLLFFSSDHGICIFDKGSFHLPPNCRNAFHVPAMILLNPALAAMTPQQVKDNLACNTDKPLTGEYDFETVAALAGISYPSADEKYDLTKRCFPPEGRKRTVSTGNKKAFYEDL